MTRIIVLAAGKGTRMNSELPKVLVPLKNRPMISYLMEAIKSSQVDPRPLVVVSPDNYDIISQALKEYDLEYVLQQKQLGTGHAVSCACEQFSQTSSAIDNVMVLYGDHPFLQAKSIQKFAVAETPALTIMPTQLPNFSTWYQNFYHWGRIIRNSQQEVEAVVEFKDATAEQKLITEVNPGFMSFNRSWLLENINNLQAKNQAQEYYLTDLVKVAFLQKKSVQTINITPEEAIGINSQEELKIAENLL